MQIGHATLNDALGTLVFMLALLSFFWSLTGWPEPPRELRRFRILITILISTSALLAEAGMIWLGWRPPWQEFGISTPPASPLDLIALPALTLLVLGLWFILSLAGAVCPPLDALDFVPGVQFFSGWPVAFTRSACFFSGGRRPGICPSHLNNDVSPELHKEAP